MQRKLVNSTVQIKVFDVFVVRSGPPWMIRKDLLPFSITKRKKTRIAEKLQVGLKLKMKCHLVKKIMSHYQICELELILKIQLITCPPIVLMSLSMMAGRGKNSRFPDWSCDNIPCLSMSPFMLR